MDWNLALHRPYSESSLRTNIAAASCPLPSKRPILAKTRRQCAAISSGNRHVVTTIRRLLRQGVGPARAQQWQDHLPPPNQSHQDVGAQPGQLCLSVLRDGGICAEARKGHPRAGTQVRLFARSLPSPRPSASISKSESCKTWRLGLTNAI